MPLWVFDATGRAVVADAKRRDAEMAVSWLEYDLRRARKKIRRMHSRACRLAWMLDQERRSKVRDVLLDHRGRPWAVVMPVNRA